MYYRDATNAIGNVSKGARRQSREDICSHQMASAETKRTRPLIMTCGGFRYDSGGLLFPARNKYKKKSLNNMDMSNRF